MTHAPCDLSLQRRILEARRDVLASRPRWWRRRRLQAGSADLVRAAFSGREDVWRSLRG